MKGICLGSICIKNVYLCSANLAVHFFFFFFSFDADYMDSLAPLCATLQLLECG